MFYYQLAASTRYPHNGEKSKQITMLIPIFKLNETDLDI